MGGGSPHLQVPHVPGGVAPRFQACTTPTASRHVTLRDATNEDGCVLRLCFTSSMLGRAHGIATPIREVPPGPTLHVPCVGPDTWDPLGSYSGTKGHSWFRCNQLSSDQTAPSLSTTCMVYACLDFWEVFSRLKCQS